MNQKIIKSILSEIEGKTKILNLRGFRGYGASHPWTPRKRLGYGVHDSSTEDEQVENIEFKPVKISRAFRKV
tara:strand:+ start:450 stop:665 length:216 start_codon:yes stop_codon:yes gene_type:complete